MQASGRGQELAALVVRHLARTKGGGRHQSHRNSIVLEFAKRGSEQARKAIYACFDPSYDYRLADEIIQLDGLDGLSWVISHLGSPPAPDSDWRFRRWLDDLSDAVGKEVVSAWLARESETRPEVAAFAGSATSKPAPRKRLAAAPPPSFEEFRAMWTPPRAVGQQMSIFRWIMSASDEEIAKAWRAFESEEDADWLRRLAMGLKRRPARADVDKVVERARAWNSKPNPFASALEEVSDPRVRKLGFDLIAAGRGADGFGLVAQNAQPGDEAVLRTAFDKLTDDDALHCAGMDLLRLGKDLDVSETLIHVYERSPCSLCRESAVRDLIERHAAPDRLLRECLYDCVAETRQMAESALR